MRTPKITVAEFKDHDWGDKVNSGIGLSYSGIGLSYSGICLSYSGIGLSYSGIGLSYSGIGLSYWPARQWYHLLVHYSAGPFQHMIEGVDKTYIQSHKMVVLRVLYLHLRYSMV